MRYKLYSRGTRAGAMPDFHGLTPQSPPPGISGKLQVLMKNDDGCLSVRRSAREAFSFRFSERLKVLMGNLDGVACL